jgi:hypothetical protein
MHVSVGRVRPRVDCDCGAGRAAGCAASVRDCRSDAADDDDDRFRRADGNCDHDDERE